MNEVYDNLWLALKILGNYLFDHPLEIIGLFLAYFSLVVPIRQYLGQKKLEEKDKRFNNYHRLIKELVGGDGVESTFVDRQIAVIFELRNYPEYFEVTNRILLGLLQTWRESDSEGARRVKNEIEITIDFINR